MDGRRRRDGIRLPAPLTAIALALAAAGVIGCGDDSDGAGTSTTSTTPTAPLRVEVDPATAAPGEKVRARVVNESAETYTYGLDYTLERRRGDSWAKVDSPGAVALIGLVAKPGETGPPVPVTIPKDAKPGEYRIVIGRDAPGVGILSGELEVTSGT